MGSKIIQATWVFFLSIVTFKLSFNNSLIVIPLGALAAWFLLKRVSIAHNSSLLAILFGVLYAYNIIALGPIDRLILKVTGQNKDYEYLKMVAGNLDGLQPQFDSCYENCGDCPRPLSVKVVIDESGILSNPQVLDRIPASASQPIHCVLNLLNGYLSPAPPERKPLSFTLYIFQKK